jgi:hypothetical protein
MIEIVNPLKKFAVLKWTSLAEFLLVPVLVICLLCSCELIFNCRQVYIQYVLYNLTARRD